MSRLQLFLSGIFDVFLFEIVVIAAASGFRLRAQRPGLTASSSLYPI